MVSTSRIRALSARLLLTLLASAIFLGSGEASAAQLTASWVDNSNGVAATRLERRLATDTTYVAIADAPPGERLRMLEPALYTALLVAVIIFDQEAKAFVYFQF